MENILHTINLSIDEVTSKWLVTEKCLARQLLRLLPICTRKLKSCLTKFGALLLRHFIPFEKLVRFKKTSDNLRLQNILTSSSLAVEIQNASSEISRTFRHGLSPRLEKLATAWAQLLSSALSCHHLKFRGSLFARPVHFHRVSVTTPLLTLPMIHGLLLELRHLTAKTSFLG